jgi:type IV secretory pathway VirB6-like protein
MKRLVLFVIALVFAFSTTVLAADAAKEVKADAKATKAEVKADAKAAKADVKAAPVKAKAKAKGKAKAKAKAKAAEVTPAAPAAK